MIIVAGFGLLYSAQNSVGSDICVCRSRFLVKVPIFCFSHCDSKMLSMLNAFHFFLNIPVSIKLKAVNVNIIYIL